MRREEQGVADVLAIGRISVSVLCAFFIATLRNRGEDKAVVRWKRTT